MKKKYLIYLMLACFVLVNKGLMAQLPMSVYYLDNIPQANYLNAAFTPRANGYVGFPFGSTMYTSVSSDISTADLFQKQGDVWATPFNNSYDYNKLYKKMGKTANLDIHQTVAPLMLGFRTKHGYVTFGVIDKADGNIAVPQAFFNMVESGLPNGSSFDFSTMNMNISYYREFAFGYSQKFTDRLTLGVHAKVLFGVGSLSTDINTFDFNVSTESWSYALDAQINGSLPVEDIYYNDEGFVDSVNLPDIDSKYVFDNMVTNFKNPGFALDVGAVYVLNEEWTFSGAINDLGFISWKDNLNNFSAEGDFVFEGLDYDLDDLSGGDESGESDLIGDITDSIKNSIELSHSTDPFTTFTTPRMFLGAQYHVNHYLSGGILSRSTFTKNNFQQDFNLSVNLNLYHFLTTSLNYNFSLNGRNSLGLGLGMRAGILQFYLVADYIPYSYTSYVIETTNDDGTKSRENIPGPEKLDNFNLMFGLNFLFGANGFQDKPMIDAYSEF